MTTIEKREQIGRIQSEINPAKERLMRAADELLEIGAFQKAKSLLTIIEKLEIWQQ